MSSIPSLKILKQTSLSVDRFSDNGVEKNLHYVIKNNEFSVLVELPSTVAEQTFNDLVIEANLLYDCTPTPKEVLQVRQKPFKYKGIVERGDARKCSLQVSVSILSSQHEDMNFLLQIRAKDSVSQDVVAEGLSEPVQVISKPDVLRKKREPKKKKRTWNDRITETLERMEAKQQETLALLAAQKSNSSFNADAFSTTVDPPKYPSEVFESAFYDLVRAYKGMSADERPTKIRKLVAGSSVMDSAVTDMVSCFHQSTKDVSGDAYPLSLDYYSKSNITNPMFESDLDLDTLVNDLFSTASV